MSNICIHTTHAHTFLKQWVTVEYLVLGSKTTVVLNYAVWIKPKVIMTSNIIVWLQKHQNWYPPQVVMNQITGSRIINYKQLQTSLSHSSANTIALYWTIYLYWEYNKYYLYWECNNTIYTRNTTIYTGNTIMLFILGMLLFILGMQWYYLYWEYNNTITGKIMVRLFDLVFNLYKLW